MDRRNVPSRSRFGCITCRRKHRKCDEKQPICQQCQSRGLECGYQMTLKWADAHSISTFDASLRRRRQDHESSTPVRQRTGTRPRSPSPSQPDTVSPEDLHFTPIDDNDAMGILQALPSSPLDLRSTSDGQGLSQPALGVLPDATTQLNEVRWLELRSIERCQESLLIDNTQISNDDDVSFINTFEITPGPREQREQSESTTNYDPLDPGPWVIDSTMSNLLFQIFQDPGEEIAFLYYCKRVCGCIPAFDNDQNPYRKLALISMSYPVLLHGILSVSTGHMHNYGRSNEALVSSRQARALKSLRAALSALLGSRASPRGCRSNHTSSSMSSDPELRPFLRSDNVFSILSAREIAFSAVMMQTSSVLMTGIGNVEIHMRCALEFIRDLGYVSQPARPLFGRLLVHRFAMVDVVLAHLRFRRPLAPPEFFMYQSNEQLDSQEPSFREMQGCPQRVLGFLAQVAWLTVELTDAERDGTDKTRCQAKAYGLETEMRIWGHKYYEAMVRGGDSSLENSGTRRSGSSSRRAPADQQRADLDIVCECFYWTAHILLLRRVFLDPARSTRVQIIRQHLFRLMSRLETGCGPDSSLPFPFYMTAREAVTAADRDWVRQKHAGMMDVYRDRSREYLMASTEKIWSMADEDARSSRQSVEDDTPFLKTTYEAFIRETDKQASYFMF